MLSEILSKQARYVFSWRYESSTYTRELWLKLLKCPNGILVKTLTVGAYPFGMHVNWNKSSNINLRCFWWLWSVGTEKNVYFKSMDAWIHLGLMLLRTLLIDSILKCL